MTDIYLTPQQLMDIFVNRADVFAVQSTTGAYFPVKRPITLDDIKKHNEGKHTIGVYCLTPDNKVSWACVDIDSESKGASVFEVLMLKKEAYRVYESFEDYPRMLEFSGRKGFHIWIFFKNKEYASFAQQLINSRLNRLKIYGHEVFPKQVELNEDRKYGNLVKMPQAKHKVSGIWSKIIEMEGVL